MSESFIHIVLDDLIAKKGLSGLADCTLIFPMQRAGLFVKQDLTERVQQSSDTQPIIVPRCVTIDALVDSLCPLLPADEIRSVCQLYHIYKNHTHHTLPIDAFYGWGVQLLNDFSSVDMAMVDGADIMHYTSTITRYEELLLEDETRERLTELLQKEGSANSVREYFRELWKALPDIYNEFRTLQSNANMGTRGARSKWVLEHWSEDYVQSRIGERTYVFVGFNYLLAAEWQLMHHLQQHEQALFYWDYDPDFRLDTNVYQFIVSNMRTFPNALTVCDRDRTTSSSHGAGSGVSITALACQSASAQAQYAHDWLLTHHRPGDKTAVVVADESLLQQVVYALPTTDELDARINITKGYPLRATQLFTQTVKLLKCAEQSDQPLSLSDIMSSLETYYRQMNAAESATWQDILIAESYYQIQKVLRQMQQLLLTDADLQHELAEARVLANLVKRQLEQVTIPFHGEPVTDIQVIGVLETRLLDFDHVLILNVEEDIVPAKSIDRSFLPYDLRREYQMATREEEARIYAYNFFRLFRRAKDVTLSFSDSFTDMGKRTMSRFLMQLLCSPDYQVTKLRLTESAQLQPFAIESTVFSATDQVPAYLSPSAISHYVECPRWFYLQHIKRYRSTQLDSVVLPPNIIGDIFHRTIYNIYQSSINNNQSATTNNLLPFLTAAYPDNLQPSEHQVENHAILAMVRQALEHDAAFPPVNIVGLEQPIETTIAVSDQESSGSTPIKSLRIKGIIDRLDIIQKDGVQYLRVLDYKTGGFDKKKVTFDAVSDQDINFDNSLITDPDKKYALQTLLYCHMLSTVCDRGGKSILHTPSAEGGPYSNLPLIPELLFVRQCSQDGTIYCGEQRVADYQHQWQDSIGKLLTELVRRIHTNMQPGQEFVMQPNNTICANSYCPFHLLCNRPIDKSRK